MPVQEESQTDEVFAPTDEVRPTIPEPPAGGTIPTASDSLVEDDFEIDPRWVEEFEGLLYLGMLTHSFTYATHRFVIKTLNNDELMLVGQAIKEFNDTAGENRAYTVAMVAASVLMVDGEPLKVPLGPERGIAALLPRFEQVRAWYPTVTDKIFEQYLILEGKAEEVMSKMGEASG